MEFLEHGGRLSTSYLPVWAYTMLDALKNCKTYEISSSEQSQYLVTEN